MDILGFGANKVLTFVLIFSRVAGVFVSAPIFGSRNVTPMVRITIALALTFVFLPLTSYEPKSLDIFAIAMTAGKEALVGVLMGYLASLVLTVIRTAGAYIDVAAGFGLVNIIDPTNQEQNSVIGQLFNLTAMLIFLVSRGHHLIIRGLADSFAILPLGQMTMTPELTGNMMRVLSTLLIAALKIAAPIVGVLFIADVAMGVIARTVPQLQVFIVGLPLKMGLTLVSVIVVFPMVVGVMIGLFAGLHHDLLTLLRLLAG